MKGNRLHRPEPPAHFGAAAAPAPADDWVDGSWTVDCSCGVTFDDGEEMVSCDECSVWVHTRCARYVRSVHTSFSCHNCRSKRAPSTADEAEVAELLAELPTHRPAPPFRRWAEVPLPARVHVHGLPGGSDSALFRSAPAFSAALWRCTGFVPKRFGFHYYEFPSWADDKDNGADALFALAREKLRETSDSVSVGGIEPKKEKHYIQSLSCHGKKIDGSQHAVPPLTEEPDIPQDRCLQRECETMPDTVHEDHYSETNMANSDSQSVKTKKKMEDSLERSGEKCFKVIHGMLNKSVKDLLKLEASAPEEVHSGSARVEVAMYNQQADVKGGMKSAIVNSGPNKMHDMGGLQKQLNLTSSCLNIADLPDLQSVQLESQIIQRESVSQGNDTADALQLDSDDRKCYRQGLRDTAGSLIDQRNSSKSTYVSVCRELPKSETGNLVDTVEHPNSLPDDAKVCASISSTISIPCELPQSMHKELSSTGNNTRSAKKELVSPTDIKHESESAKVSEESSQQVTQCSEKVHPKNSIVSASKSYQESRIYTPTVKPRLPVSKEQLQKASTTGGTPAKLFHEEVLPVQSRNKAVASSSSQRKDKIHQRTIHVTQEGSNNSTSIELRASDSTASLSDEQLALLLHQQLNSSPRVPRVPRCHQAAGSQMLHSTGASVFSKRSSAHGGRDNATVLKKRNREDTFKDSEDTRRAEKASFVNRRHKDSSAEHVPSVKASCRSAENIALEQRNYGLCSTGANTGLPKDDTVDTSVLRNLPGLIAGIVSKNRSITHEELCVAVHQHFRDMRKPSEEDPSFLRAINDCLRKRREWAYLVEQAPKTNSNKWRKEESDNLLDDVPQAENMRPERDSKEGSADLHQEDLPRGKRKARKRRRLELKGRRVRDTRKRSNIDSSSEDAAAVLSDSSSNRNDTTMDAVNQEDYSIAP